MPTTSDAVVCVACGARLVPEAAFRKAPPRCQTCDRWAAILTRDDQDFLRTNRIVARQPSSSEVAA